MALLPIIRYPDPIFSTVATPVKAVDAGIKQHLLDMREACEAHQALGLGANMVGITERLIVARASLDDECYLMANPVIEPIGAETALHREASLSLPGISAKVSRHASIKVTYLDIDNEQKCIEARGWLAAIIQHECDYLDARLFIDHLKPLKRKLLLQKMGYVGI